MSIDVHDDGTTWALIAFDRDERGSPTSLALSRFEGDGWTSVEPPVELDGTPRLRAGPDGTGWIIGLEASADCGRNQHQFGPTGLWRFDGTEWSSEQAEVLSLGDRVAYDGGVEPEGTLWTVGISQIGMIATSFGQPYFEGSYAVSSFDGQGWTDVAIPDHYFYGLDCQRLFLDGNGTVWLDWADAVLPEEGGRDDFSIHARLDGNTWTQYENPFDAVVDDPGDELAGLSQRTVGSDGGYAFLIIGDVRAFAPGLAEPAIGDVKPIGGIIFDGENWAEEFTGELTITDGHTITPFADRGEGNSLRGDVTATTALVGDAIYLTGFGGLISIGPTGEATTLTTNDGLVSNGTNHVTATPDGVLWVATDAGISRYVPATSFPDPPIEVESFAKEGDVLTVMGRAYDDWLAVGGASVRPVTPSGNNSADLVATGRARSFAGSIWYEVEVFETVGWADSSFVGFVGATDDATAEFLAQNSSPASETLADLGLLVALSYASADPLSLVVQSWPGRVADVSEVIYDVIGIGDDAVAGYRLHVFATPVDSGEGFDLKSIERTTFCSRGVDGEQCI